MRIFNAEEDYLYIQLKDIRYINARKDLKAPRTLLRLVWESGYPNINSENQNQFIKVEDPKLKSFILQLCCLVDYNQIRNLSIKKLTATKDYYKETQDILREKLPTAKTDEIQSLETGIIDLENRQDQIQSFIYYKNGVFGIDSLVLPEGVEYPTKGRTLKYILDKRKYDKEHNKKAA